MTDNAHDSLALFSLDAQSATPPFQQLHNTVIAAVSSGLLPPGAKLPTVRGLAAHLGIAANTVAAAYRQLEAAGVAEGRGRAGTFVKLDTAGNPVEAEARRIVLEAVAALTGLGVTRERARELLDEAFLAAR